MQSTLQYNDYNYYYHYLDFNKIYPLEISVNHKIEVQENSSNPPSFLQTYEDISCNP